MRALQRLIRTVRLRRGLGIGLFAVMLIGVLGAGFIISPASATDGNSGSVDTGRTSVYTQPGDKDKGDDCTGDKCKRINWCDGSGKEDTKPLTGDAPVVYTNGDKGKTDKCIKKPVIKYECCVADKTGTASISVTVTNPNKHGFKVRVWVDNGEPIVKMVGGNAIGTFRFTDIENGSHKVNAAVKSDSGKWCKFGDTTVKVECAKPSHSSSSPAPSSSSKSPSASQSSSKSPSASVSASSGSSEPVPSASVSTTPASNTGTLPKTGDTIATVATIGVMLLVAGAVLFWLSRRRRTHLAA